MLSLKMDVTRYGNSSAMCMTFLEFRHTEMTAAQKGQKGLRQLGQTGGLKCPHKTAVRKKKKTKKHLREEGKIRKQKVAEMQLNEKKKSKREWTK